jgi:hypothetical protein
MAQPNQLDPTTQKINVFDGALQGGNTWSSSPIANILAYTSCTTAGVRQGVLNVGIYRASTNVLATWDGNKDIAMKITAYNSAANGTNGGVEGLEILARNTGTGATNALVKGMACTAENKTGAGQVTSVLTAEFSLKNNGVVATSAYGVQIIDESQGTNPAATAMLRFTTGGDNAASGATPVVINVAAANSNGFTYLFDFTADTKNTALLAGTVGAAAGTILIRVAGTPYKLLFYAV